MEKRTILLVIFIAVLCYPVFTAYQYWEVIAAGRGIEVVENQLISYQISIWITWVITVAMAVYYKWTEKNNLMFYVTYGFIVAAFILFGAFSQMMVNEFDLPSPFEDDYTLGVFAAIQNIFVSALLTGFLHAGVWWFTRRWHRR